MGLAIPGMGQSRGQQEFRLPSLSDVIQKYGRYTTLPLTVESGGQDRKTAGGLGNEPTKG
jgi:hypothetical protein